MSDGGKGSKPRPLSISQQEYDTRWDAIFSRDLKDDNTGTSKNEYYDVLTTEDALRSNQETQEAAKFNGSSST
jgi:hypothetical protein